MFSQGGELPTQTGAVEQWIQHFEELLNPVNTSPVEEAESNDSREASPVSFAEVAEVVRKLPGGKALDVDDICTERCGVVLVDIPLQYEEVLGI